MNLAEIGIRLGVVVAGVGAWFWTQSLIGKRPMPEGRIGDRLHDLTEPWNDALCASVLSGRICAGLGL